MGREPELVPEPEELEDPLPVFDMLEKMLADAREHAWEPLFWALCPELMALMAAGRGPAWTCHQELPIFAGAPGWLLLMCSEGTIAYEGTLGLPGDEYPR